MKRFPIIIALAALFTACVSDPTGEPTQESTPASKIVNPNAEPAEGYLMLKLSAGSDSATLSEIAGIDLEIKPLFNPSTRAVNSSLDNWYLLSFDKSIDVKALAERMASYEGVKRVEYDVIFERPKSYRAAKPMERPEPTRSVEYPFNDPELSWQWHYNNDGSLSEDSKAGADINLLNAWKYTAGDNRVIVAVVDGGIMADHPDLKDNMWVNEAEKNGLTGVDDDANGYIDDIHGLNCVQMNGNITADAHGTHVAGTISAVNNNNFAVCGIAGGTGKGDGVRLMSVQIFEGEDGCYTHQIARGIEYAADNGAVIANNSWGFVYDAYYSDGDYLQNVGILQEAIEYFKGTAKLEGTLDGGMMIFAAGNDSVDYANYPGAYNSNICVAAMAPNFTPAFYTNYGPGTNITAPGGDSTYGTIMAVSSTSVEYAYGDGYEYMHGTSMATPHVSGCVALAISYALKQGYHFTANELTNILLTSVHDINQYMKGSRYYYDYKTNSYPTMQLSKYKYKMGTGYIDAHKLLMQMDGTPCLYFNTGEEALLSLNELFGDGAKDITFKGVEISDSVREALGIQSTPTIEQGALKILCTKPGIGRIKIKAIAGDTLVGGDNLTGGMLIEREFEIVARGSVATNGGWL